MMMCCTKFVSVSISGLVRFFAGFYIIREPVLTIGCREVEPFPQGLVAEFEVQCAFEIGTHFKVR